MNRAHIITLSGKPGSGKSSTADKVAELLGYTRYSAGDFVRKNLRSQHLSLAEFNKKALTNPALDEEIDAHLRSLRDEKDVVVDSRLGFHWIPESFKVYLDLDIDVATVRIFKDRLENKSRSMEYAMSSDLSEVQKQVRSRINTERRRFKSWYGVDPYDTSRFDLVINTARHSPQTVAIHIFDVYKKWLKTETWQQKQTEVPIGYNYDDGYTN